MIDLLLRGGAISVLALLAALLWRGPPAQRFFALACLCGALFLLVKSAEFASALGPMRPPVQAIAATGPLWFFVATQQAFGAKPEIGARLLAALGLGVVALALGACFAEGRLGAGLAVALDLTLLGLFLTSLGVAWRGLADDLVPNRRAQRLLLMAACAAFGALVAAGALATSLMKAPASANSVMQTLIAAGCLVAAWAYAAASLRLTPTPAPSKSPPAAPTALAGAILEAMTRDKLYRQPDLTLAALAQVMRAPAHKVRAAINTEIGFSNFSAFVNSYRLGEVKAALADASQAETPISTIALDAGFGSIPSFNRVFKVAFGVAPSAFRQKTGL